MVVRIGRNKPLRFRKMFLKEHREAAGLTQEQLAERIGTTKATVSRIERGSRDYTGGFLEAAADALGKPDVSVFYRPPEDASLYEKLSQVPAEARGEVSLFIDQVLKTGTRK